MAEGRLDMAEFQERLEATYQARTYGELAPITRDLPSAAGAGAAPVSFTKAPAPAGGPDAPNWPARVGREPTSSGAFAVCGGFTRKGRWTIGRLFTAFMFWGGGELDLREASFESREVTIRCFAIMGGLQVTVPPGLNVRVNGVGVLGAFDGMHDFQEVGDPDAPWVTVTGFALMGGVGVERKVTRAEKQRLRAELQRAKEERRLEAREARREQHDEYHRSRHHDLQARREHRRSAREDRRDARRGRWSQDDH
jgi:hypothetical protein